MFCNVFTAQYGSPSYPFLSLEPRGGEREGEKGGASTFLFFCTHYGEPPFFFPYLSHEREGDACPYLKYWRKGDAWHCFSSLLLRAIPAVFHECSTAPCPPPPPPASHRTIFPSPLCLLVLCSRCLLSWLLIKWLIAFAAPGYRSASAARLQQGGGRLQLASFPNALQVRAKCKPHPKLFWAEVGVCFWWKLSTDKEEKITLVS